MNVGQNQFSRIQTWELGGLLHDQLPDFSLFRIEEIPYYLEDIGIFFTIGVVSQGYSRT
jgi:hypothetical protein